MKHQRGDALVILVVLPALFLILAEVTCKLRGFDEFVGGYGCVTNLSEEKK